MGFLLLKTVCYIPAKSGVTRTVNYNMLQLNNLPGRYISFSIKYFLTYKRGNFVFRQFGMRSGTSVYFERNRIQSMKKTISHIYSNYSTTLFFTAFALLLGGSIYILWRPIEPQFFSFFSETGLYNLINSLRQSTVSNNTLFPRWLIFSLPNGLWAFAYTIIITTIWAGSKSKIRYFWLISIPVLVLGFEVLQLTEIIYGTFCIQDIVAGIAGIIIGIIVKNKITKIKNHETKTT